MELPGTVPCDAPRGCDPDRQDGSFALSALCASPRPGDANAVKSQPVYVKRRAIRREDRDPHRDRVGDCELAHANLLLGALNTFGRSGEGEFLSCRPPGAATQPATRFRTVRYRHGDSRVPLRSVQLVRRKTRVISKSLVDKI
jgi:hypothetical protein